MGLRSNNPWIRLLQFLILWILSSGLFFMVIVVPFYPDFLGKKDLMKSLKDDFLFEVLSQLAALCGSVFAFWKMKRRTEHESLIQICRFDLFQFARGSAIGFAIMVVCLFAYLIFGLVTLSFNSVIDLPKLFPIFLLVAIVEELVFRGYFLETLSQRMNPLNAILFSSLIFSVFHLGNDHISALGFINIFLSGVLLGQLYWEGRNLSLSIGLHFTWNLFQSIFGFSVSGHSIGNIFLLKSQSANTLYTGGEFGMEGSLLLLPIVLASIFLFRNNKVVVIN